MRTCRWICSIRYFTAENKRFDFNYVNDQINGIVQDPFYKVETMGDYQIPMST